MFDCCQLGRTRPWRFNKITYPLTRCQESNNCDLWGSWYLPTLQLLLLLLIIIRRLITASLSVSSQPPGYAYDPDCMYVNGSGRDYYEFFIQLNRCGTLGKNSHHDDARKNPTVSGPDSFIDSPRNRVPSSRIIIIMCDICVFPRSY